MKMQRVCKDGERVLACGVFWNSHLRSFLEATMIVKEVAKDDSGLAQQSIADEAPPAASHQVPASSQDLAT